MRWTLASRVTASAPCTPLAASVIVVTFPAAETVSFMTLSVYLPVPFMLPAILINESREKVVVTESTNIEAKRRLPTWLPYRWAAVNEGLSRLASSDPAIGVMVCLYPTPAGVVTTCPIPKPIRKAIFCG